MRKSSHEPIEISHKQRVSRLLPFLILFSFIFLTSCDQNVIDFVRGALPRPITPAQGPPQASPVLPFYRASAINLTPAKLNFLVIGSVTFYVGYDPQHGAELWKTDGTNAGTVMVADISPGVASSQPSNFCNVGGILFFSADDGVHGSELWKSDGTTSGTVLIKDIQLGASGSGINGITALPNGVVIFRATDGTNPDAAWRSDGTAAGTYMLVNAQPNYPYPVQFTVVGSQMFFVSGVGIGDLVVTDGTNAGTLILGSGINPKYLTSYNGLLYYSPYFNLTSNLLWKSDGTIGGTVGVTDFGTGGPFGSNLQGIYNMNSKLLISVSVSGGFKIAVSDGTAPGSSIINNNALLTSQAFDFPGYSLMFVLDFASLHGEALWKTDGTAPGTLEVKDFNSSVTTDTRGDIVGGPGSYSNIVKIGSKIFFGYDDKVNGHQLWGSDGTTAGTVFIKNISGSTATSNISQLIALRGQLIFSAQDSLGTELWTSDGTNLGTSMVKDLLPGAGSSQPQILTQFAGKILFAAANPSVGAPTLYLTDGTSSGTTALAQARVVAMGLNYNNSLPVTALNNQVFFSGNDHSYGVQFWKTDGTATGAVLNANMIIDIFPNGSCSSVANLMVLNTSLFFSANDLAHASSFASTGEPWISDGTTAGTQILKDIYPGPSNSGVSGPTKVNNQMFFSADDGVNGVELWVTDGTPAGTVLVKDINPGAAASTPNSLTALGNLVIFVATTAANGTELWVSDGTNAGTQMLSDINAGAASSAPANLTVAGSKVFFTADDGVNGPELWVTDGTPAGTVLVKDLNPGAAGSYPSKITALNSTTVVFNATTAATGYELFVSDGTAGGTLLLKDIVAGATSSSPSHLIKVGNKIIFDVDDGVNGDEFWVTDGTPSGTMLLKDINPGVSPSTPITVALYNNQLIFKATDAINKTQLWITDGTPSGTLMLTSLNTANAGISIPSTPTSITYKSKLYFAMDDGVHGSELWTTDGTAQGTSMLLDLSPGSGSSNPFQFQIMGNHLFYFARLDDRGVQLIMIP
jgi:ELWxxDGT repeat protein